MLLLNQLIFNNTFMEWNNWYIDWIEDMWNKCPNCDSIDFDIIHRKCLICDYELSHNTLQIILPIKKAIEEKIETTKKRKSFFEDPYDSLQRWYEEDKKYWK